MIKISLLIPTLPGRVKYLERLLDCLLPQVDTDTGEIEVLTDATPKYMTIGAKRNRLLAKASGQYVAFIDDDDLVSKTYIRNLLLGVAAGADVVSLRGIITTDGYNPLIFEHSLRYTEYRTVTPKFPGHQVTYERFPNHLNCIRASIAKQFEFPEKNFSEDTEWATAIHESKLLKNEFYVDDILYHYLYRSKK